MSSKSPPNTGGKVKHRGFPRVTNGRIRNENKDVNVLMSVLRMDVFF